jgi:hypothetical protein
LKPAANDAPGRPSIPVSHFVSNAHAIEEKKPNKMKHIGKTTKKCCFEKGPGSAG